MKEWWFITSWWLQPTPLKNISQNGNLPQKGMKVKPIWNHHLVLFTVAIDFRLRPWKHMQTETDTVCAHVFGNMTPNMSSQLTRDDSGRQFSWWIHMGSAYVNGQN